MKKHSIILALALLAGMVAFAQQEVLKQPKYKFGFGLKGGVNIANMRYTFDEFADYEKSFLVKPQFGVFADFPLGQQFSIGGEFDYYGRGVKMHKYVDEDYGNVDYRIDAQYFDIRMPLVYSFYPRYMFTPYVVLAPGLGIAKGGS
ncbi:MAG: outer membrane beta-barrel protein, partial [Bacteroidales bacterium]|nr:outer membrane beta-barrel protein [Bacteroidales bacterium]